MDKTYFLSQPTSLTFVIVISLLFVFLGLYNSKKYQGLKNYLTANRNIGLFSLTTSLTASALGAWILFGPASAATWGGIGAIIGYSLGTAFPMIFLIYLGKKIRKEFPKGSSLIEFMRKKFGKSLFKLILLMTIFYMFIFLCAEVTAVAVLINYISGTELWITALIVLLSTLTYTLYGGLRASIFTDNIQMVVIGVLLLVSLAYINSFTGSEFSFEFINKNNPHLLSSSYIPSYTAGLTFFIAVASTNLFHQGNWQRVYAAKNFETLRKSLIISFFIIIPVVFYMGFTGMVAFSIDPNTRPDLGFFTLLLKEQTKLLALFVILLGLALTISTVDTLVNAISSLIIVDGKATFNLNNKTNYLNLSKYVILFLSLFLLADLFCCAFVLTVFYSFYNKTINEKTAYISILIGLIGGFLMFPSPDFSQSLLVGILFPKELFAPFVSQSLLFLSFLIATFLPLIVFKAKRS
ncbi:sodium:solute symporter [Candidatus Pelagibacter sp.]|nr:sodium:solute symporter [Candidatus Pelagibacter sp.]